MKYHYKEVKRDRPYMSYRAAYRVRGPPLSKGYEGWTICDRNMKSYNQGRISYINQMCWVGLLSCTLGTMLMNHRQCSWAKGQCWTLATHLTFVAIHSWLEKTLQRLQLNTEIVTVHQNLHLPFLFLLLKHQNPRRWERITLQWKCVFLLFQVPRAIGLVSTDSETGVRGVWSLVWAWGYKRLSPSLSNWQ